MIQTNWHIITGGPSSGKTTLINELNAMGFRTSAEIARAFMKEQVLANHHSLDDIKKHVLRLQRDILTRMLKREHTLPKNELIFFDRGTPDSLAYFHFHHFNDPLIMKACEHYIYKKVFFCHPLPVVKDDIRDEDDATAKKISDFIYKAYQSLGYNPIALPAVSIEQRLQIILSHVHPEKFPQRNPA